MSEENHQHDHQHHEAGKHNHSHSHDHDEHNHSHAHSLDEHESKLKDYLPLILLVAGVLIATVVWEIIAGRFMLREAVRVFMGFFFLFFGLLKVPDLKGFVSAFTDYDIVAKRSRIYAHIYPFIELALGTLLLLNLFLVPVLVITAVIMFVGSIGVINAVVRGRQIRCACMGTLVNLPMSTVTIVEDVGMGLMALFMFVI